MKPINEFALCFAENNRTQRKECTGLYKCTYGIFPTSKAFLFSRYKRNRAAENLKATSDYDLKIHVFFVFEQFMNILKRIPAFVGM